MLCWVMVMPVSLANAAVPQTMNYQGYLTDASGQPVDGTLASMTFALYTAGTGSTALWTETQINVNVAKGTFTVELGALSPLDSSKLPQADLWLGITINAESEMVPRQKLAAVPFAVKAAVADSLAEGAVTGPMVQNGAVKFDKLDQSCAEGQVLVMTATGWACGTWSY